MRKTTTEWRARPVATSAVKAGLVLVPMIVGTVVGFVVAGLVPVPTGVAFRMGWFVLVLTASTVALLTAERLARRVAPLALLLKLGLVFPEQVPNRFGVALKAIRPRRHEAGELEAAESLALLASLLAHDRRTRGHCERVAAYAEMIAEELGVDSADRDRLIWGALLHDIGKLEVPSRILTKPSTLDDREWSIMRGHPAFGSALVDPLRPWLGDALSAVDGHHERFDGTGYPYRRPSVSLPLAARVVAVADAFETMTAARSYKDPIPVAAARAEVAACAGSHFDPAVCRAFLALSVPRLWWVAGPLSLLAQVPLIGLVARGEIVPAAVTSAAQGAAQTTGQAVTAAAVMGGALFVGGAADHLLVQDTGRATSAVSVETASAVRPMVTDPARPRDSGGDDDDSSGSGGGGADRPDLGEGDPAAGSDSGSDPSLSTDDAAGADGLVDPVVDPVVDDLDGVVDPVVDLVDDLARGNGDGGNGNHGDGNNGVANSGNGDDGNGSNRGDGDNGVANSGNANTGNANSGNGSSNRGDGDRGSGGREEWQQRQWGR